MTRDKILKMDGQELCRWLDNRNVLMRVGEDLYKTYHGDYIICVCAFAARYWCITQSKCYQWEGHLPDYSLFDSPLEWLRAAAIVIKENEK